MKRLTPAAVLVPLIKDSQSLLLTKRSQLVAHHKGEISFPGGMQDIEDSDLLETALRETFEETGLQLQRHHVIKQLPCVSTMSSRFSITPFLGHIDRLPVLKLNPDEIDKILIYPLVNFTAPGALKFKPFGLNGLLPTYEIDGEIIWGATALIIHRYIVNEGQADLPHR